MALADFDRYCVEHAIQPDEVPEAFAAWLHEITNGKWDAASEEAPTP